jgi:hypothetical protein
MRSTGIRIRGGPSVDAKRSPSTIMGTDPGTQAPKAARSAFTLWGPDRHSEPEECVESRTAGQMKGNVWKSGSSVQGLTVLGQRTNQSCPPLHGNGFGRRAILRHTELPQQSSRGLGQTLVHRKRLKLTGRRKAIQELTAAAKTRRPIT